MNDFDTTSRALLTEQLAAIKQLQLEVEQKMAEHDEARATVPVAPWLARRGAANHAVAPRTLPPWLARRGR